MYAKQNVNSMVATAAVVAGARAFAVAGPRGAATRVRIFMLKPASLLRSGWFWVGALLFVAMNGGYAGTAAAVRLLAVGAIDLLLYRIIKRSIAPPLPSMSNKFIERPRPLDSFSFPSGPVMHDVACCVVLTAYFPAAAEVVWPRTILTALSLVVLGLHYPSDVLAGAVLGATAALQSFDLL